MDQNQLYKHRERKKKKERTFCYTKKVEYRVLQQGTNKDREREQ